MVADARQTFQDSDGGQVCATIESMVSDAGHALRDGD